MLMARICQALSPLAGKSAKGPSGSVDLCPDDIVVKIEPGVEGTEDVFAARQYRLSNAARSVISLSSDSEVGSPVKRPATNDEAGRADSVISISSDSEDDSPATKKPRIPTKRADSSPSAKAAMSPTTLSQSAVSSSSGLELPATQGDQNTTTSGMSGTPCSVAANSSDKENGPAGQDPAASLPHVILHAPARARSSRPRAPPPDTAKVMARTATLSVPFKDGKPPTSLAQVNQQAIDAMRKIVGHILQGTVVTQPMPGAENADRPASSWVEAELPLHLPEPEVPDVAMKEYYEAGEAATSDDGMDTDSERRSMSVKSSAASSSSNGDWLIDMCEDPPFPGVWSFEVWPSLRDQANGPAPKFHICATWMLKIAIWFRVSVVQITAAWQELTRSLGRFASSSEDDHARRCHL